jgi:hypothetical protein
MKRLVSRILLLIILMIFSLKQSSYSQVSSIARDWNNMLLFAIRHDFARPTVHARNLYHQSLIAYEAWAAFDPSKEHLFLGDTLHGYVCPFDGVTIPIDVEAAREKAISYASYRFIKNRFQNSPGIGLILTEINNYMASKGYSTAIVSTDYTQGPAELGNYLAQQIQLYGLQDGSNQSNNYQNQFYTPINPPIAPFQPGNPTIQNPNHWQQISLPVSIDQAGNVIQSTPPHLTAEWGNVQPFAMDDSLSQLMFRNGHNYKVYNNPGYPPKINTLDSADWDSFYKWNHTLVSIWQSHLDPSDNVMWDISPGSIGNNTWYPTDSTQYASFYDLENGGDASSGHAINPVTGLPYPSNIVPRGDYARVLAEFWADGINSETPPGHWFEIYHQTSNHPLFEFKWGGVGPDLSTLEYDVKAHLALGGAMHDAAITAWSVKGYHDFIRPLSAIRYMADQGQSSDPNLPNYSTAGIPLLQGFVELVYPGDPLAGASNENVGKIKLFTWRGHDYIQNQLTDVAGVGWILAERWWPYQRQSFVTPPFSGYISGHSTFSRTAAEVMTLMTGDPFFPGGVGEFVTVQNEFLEFEDGPSVPVTLQWATYRDASDQCSLSRIWGGIHPPCDDIPGRFIGMELGPLCFSKADTLFNSIKPALIGFTWQDTLINLNDIGQLKSLVFEFNQPMNVGVIPTVEFMNQSVNNVLINPMYTWLDSTHFRVKYACIASTIELQNIEVTIQGLMNQLGGIQSNFTLQTNLTIDMFGPSLVSSSFSSLLINEGSVNQAFTFELVFNQSCDTTLVPQINFLGMTNPNSTFILSPQSNWLNDSTYLAVYDLFDNNDDVQSILLTISNVFDLNLNELVQTTVNTSITIDTDSPTLLTYAISDSLFTLADLSSPIAHLTIHYNQQMNNLFIPSVQFESNNLPINNFTLIPNQSYWLTDSTYYFSFYLNNYLENHEHIDVVIGNTFDINGNSPMSNSFINVAQLDLVKPLVSSLSSSHLVISDSLVGSILYTVDVVFDEKMDVSVKPNVQLTYNNALINSIQYNFIQSDFLDSLNFRAYFVISDLAEEIDSIAVKVEFAKDKNGNWSNLYSVSNFITLDTKNPELLVFYANDYNLITGDIEFTNLLVFNESMATFNVPQMSFSDAFISTTVLTDNATNSFWMNPETYQLSFAVNNIDYQNSVVNVAVLGATDLAGNNLVLSEHANYCSFDLTTVAGISELVNTNLFVYPNPYSIGNEGLSIKGALGLAMVKMDIYSLEGKLVQSVDFSSTDGMNYKCLPIHLSAGMYQIQNTELGINLPLIVQN